MTNALLKELELNEYVFIDGEQRIGSGVAAPCTIILAQGKESQPAYLGHFFPIANADGMVNLRILSMLQEALAAFGGQLHLKIRGNSFFPHEGEHLRPMQMQQRRILEGMLESFGISADIAWAEDNRLTDMIFDARTGQDTVETQEYVPPSLAAKQ